MLWSKKNTSFFDYFERHSLIIQQAAVFLKNLFQGDISREVASLKIKELEHEADQITHEVIKQLCVSNFIPPLDHQDILSFVNALDDVVDFIDDSAEALVEVFQIEEVTDFGKKLANEILRGAALVVDLCPLLRQPARHLDRIQQICTEIHLIENESDLLKKEALKELFAHYSGSKQDFAWDRIYGFLERATDKVEDCANIAEQILMKYS